MSHSAPHSPQSAGPEPTSPGPGPDPGPSPDSTKVLEKPRLSGSSEAPADNTESSPEDLLGLVLCDSCIDTPLPAVKSCLTCLVSFCSSHLRPHLENPKFCSHRLLDPLQDVERRTCEIHHQSLDWFCVPDQECICEGCVEEAHRGHERRSVEEARRSVEVREGGRRAEKRERTQERRE
ncbi:unnamed protein product [Knipowitschia caucasica]|uniref:B box-type domain-containing protein n=1 Tax=Knipowitschia caucasica TaxID=637954 RepID=A0AAV2LH17_KNICA